MALNRPSATELLAVVRDFLKTEIAPDVPAAKRFHLLVAQNVLAIVEREIAGRPAADTHELQGLRTLLNTPPDEGDLTVLNTRLVSEIRAGAFDAPERRRALVAHLKSTTAAKLAIDNPRYK